MDKVLVEIFCYVITYSSCQASLDRSTRWILYKEEKTPVIQLFIPFWVLPRRAHNCLH